MASDHSAVAGPGGYTPALAGNSRQIGAWPAISTMAFARNHAEDGADVSARIAFRFDGRF
jgi:hypothetical protein